MNILRVTGTNFRCWPTLDVAIRPGCVAIIGPNGTGKSSILVAVDVALFGGKLERFLRRGETEMEVAVELEHGDVTYRVRRHYSARARGKSGLDFARFEGGEWQPLTLESQAATQERIEATLRLSRSTLRASAYLAQGDGGAFTEATPAARKVVLAEVLGLDVWDNLYGYAVEDRRVATAKLNMQRARVDIQSSAVEGRAECEADLDAERRMLRQAEEGAIQADERLAAIVEEESLFREAQSEFEAQERLVHELRQTRDANERQIGVLRERIDAYDTDWAQAENLRQRARQIPSLEEQIEAVRREQAAWDSLNQAATQARQEAVRANREAQRSQNVMDELRDQAENRKARKERTEQNAESVCETCGQPMSTPAAKGRVLAALDSELDDLRKRYAAERDAHRRYADAEAAANLAAQVEGQRPSDPVDAKAALLGAKDAATRVATLEGRRESIEQMRAELKTALAGREQMQTDLDVAEKRLREVLAARGAQRPDVATAQTASRTAAGRVRHLSGEVSMREERLRQIDRAAIDLAESRKEASRLESEIALCERLIKAFGKDGIPALIVENAAIPQIEVEAARILEDLGAPYRVELRTQRALKSGDGLRDTLDIVVVTDDGEAMYEDFSGGEKTRLNLALRIALARLLAHRAGADVRFLAIDEPEFLDAAGTERLANVLKGLRGDFDSIVLISHMPELRDAFDDVIVLQPREVAAVV